MFFVYLLTSLKNKKSYIGFTSKKPEIRLQEHNLGSDKFTRENGPWKMVYYEQFICEACARNREKFLKTGIGKNLKNIIIKYFKSGT